MKSTLEVIVVVIGLICSSVNAQRQGVKATYTNRNSPFQSFVTLAGRPYVHGPILNRNGPWCDLPSRNCHRYDEMHDWGFNFSATFEFNFTNYWTKGVNYTLGAYMMPNGCAQIIVDGNEIFNGCGIHQSPGGVPFDNDTDWEAWRDTLCSHGICDIAQHLDSVSFDRILFVL
jgi:hypothetical protein